MVNGVVSIPLAFHAASALSVASGMAGKTTAFSPTMFWQSGEPRNSTHLSAGGATPELADSAERDLRSL
jgi:hypothetical protein